MGSSSSVPSAAPAGPVYYSEVARGRQNAPGYAPVPTNPGVRSINTITVAGTPNVPGAAAGYPNQPVAYTQSAAPVFSTPQPSFTSVNSTNFGRPNTWPPTAMLVPGGMNPTNPNDQGYIPQLSNSAWSGIEGIKVTERKVPMPSPGLTMQTTTYSSSHDSSVNTYGSGSTVSIHSNPERPRAAPLTWSSAPGPQPAQPAPAPAQPVATADDTIDTLPADETWSPPQRPDPPTQLPRAQPKPAPAADTGPETITDSKGCTWQRSAKVIGTGGYGTVFEGIGSQGQLVAIKEIKSPASSLEAMQEATLISSLVHANIVVQISWIQQPNRLLIVMEHMAGGSLYSQLERYRTLSEERTRKCATDVLNGLHYLHQNDILHRDIKPHNILLDSNGNCKLSDFGCARMSPQTFDTNGLTGTPLYLAPELINGKVTKGCDIWAVGITLVQLMTGSVPYDPEKIHPGVPQIAVIYHIAQNEPTIPKTLSETATHFVEQCLKKNYESRWTAAQLLQHPWLQLQ
eukprot:TRINITY_DN7429_c0_g1_i1.p1 TRINITY_DN7429_c0_g1~~TRINITY_DN7429_c0_g1_i1.p1  ORF type:complete len:515 (-),score=60.15 TRINITY_DN7429_c0_g1_i1:438-1982(-)